MGCHGPGEYLSPRPLSPLAASGPWQPLASASLWPLASTCVVSLPLWPLASPLPLTLLPLSPTAASPVPPQSLALSACCQLPCPPDPPPRHLSPPPLPPTPLFPVPPPPSLPSRYLATVVYSSLHTYLHPPRYPQATTFSLPARPDARSPRSCVCRARPLAKAPVLTSDC